MYLIRKTKLNPVLKNRLKINYLLIKVANEYGLGEKRKVRKLLSGIRSAYKGADYSEKELLRLSNYFKSYGHVKYAEETLYPIIKAGTENKELIFFYLMLTLENTKFNKHSWYHELMEQAFEMDQKRFCKLFDNRKEGGLSFQLLRFSEVKERVCEWCPG